MNSILEPDEVEIAKIMSNLPEFSWLKGADPTKIRHEINTVLRNLRDLTIMSFPDLTTL